MPKTETIESRRSTFISAATEQEFIEGDLAESLRSAYPELFDDDDLKLVQPNSQPRMLMKNWMAAIDLFQREGWMSLQDPYFKPSHSAKHTRMRELVPAAVADLLTRHASPKAGGEPPNLLAFREGDRGTTEWRFAHVVKNGTSELDPKKLELFQSLFELTGQRIWMIQFEVVEGPLRFERLPSR